jgi:hypothetical protein
MISGYGTPIRVVGSSNKTLTPIQMGGAEAKYNERWVQELIHAHPSCLPVDEIEPGFGDLVPVCMELPTRHGPIDNLLISREGNIAIVEVKLWRNPEARRKAVAQALDYASCLFDLDYCDLEKAAKSANFGKQKRPARLFDLFDRADADEASFVDAINNNLRKGRVLIIVAGDGIRTEAARLASVLQSHAGAHFTFALVELSVYGIPDEEGWFVCPRTLLKTEMISRGIVEIHEGRARITPPDSSHTAVSNRRPESITAEQFYEAMAEKDRNLPDKIRNLLIALDPLGVYPEFKGSLNLKWDPPEGRPINLGYIKRTGEIWTDAVNWTAPNEISHGYIEELAKAFSGRVEKVILKNWHVRIGDSVPRIWQIADKLDRWSAAIRRFIQRLTEHLEENAR